MSSDTENNPSVCPKCGSELDSYNGDGRECTNDDCRWIDPLGGGETVGRSPAHKGGINTDTWPSELPRDIYHGEKQPQVIEACIRRPKIPAEKNFTNVKRELSDTVGCSPATVAKALNKARLFLAPDETALPVPEQPTITTVVERLVDHPDARFDRDDFAPSEQSDDGKAIPDGEIESIRARVLAGESTSEIAEDYQASRKAVYDRAVGRAGDGADSSIPALEYTGDGYVVPEGKPEDSREVEVRRESVETVVVCPGCPVYWESVPDSWGVCPRCGSELIEADHAEGRR
jgi:ribosomal protein S27AE